MKSLIETLADGVFKIVCPVCKTAIIPINWLIVWLKNVIYYDNSSIASICIYLHASSFQKLNRKTLMIIFRST